MAQDVLEAIKEEIELIDEIVKWLDEQEKKEELKLGDSMYRTRLKDQRSSYRRIVNRVDKGLHYRLGIKEGKVSIIVE